MTTEKTVQERIDQLIRPEIQALQAYPVGDASGMIKLDAMENPFSWSAELRKEWADFIQTADINRYPHPQAPEVKEGLRRVMNIPDQYGCLLGNGSDEIIQMLAMAVARPGATIMAPEPGFVMYKMIATFCGLNYVGVPLNEDLTLNADAVIQCIEKQQPALIFLAQPNNPTGNLYPESDLRRVIEASQGLVVMDEAYLPFSSRDHLNLLDDYDNVVVMRTLSKVGLAGLRLGMLFGQESWLNEFEKIRMPYNINVLTQLSAEFALSHYDVLMQQCAVIREERLRINDTLTTLGFDTFPSEANFILARVPSDQLSARELFEQLKQRNILIKCVDGAHPLLTECLRFTVGSPEENDALLHALRSIISDN